MATSDAGTAGAATARLGEALAGPDPSERLQAAMAAGTRPNPEYVATLVDRCAVEPDFSVRDTLTWALVRHPRDVTVPLLLGELRSEVAQARSQALHTLSKIGDPRGWTANTAELLTDPDDEVARSAWRAAVVLVPDGAESDLAAVLATQLGRGHREVRLSLSRALVGLRGAADAVLAKASASDDVEVRTHAVATQRLVRDPDEGFDASVSEAVRIVALMDVPAGAAAAPSPAADREASGGDQ